MQTQLYIYKDNNSSVYEAIELYPDESINVTYEVNDLKSLDRRSSMYSKTFNIPGTKNNNKIFGELFNVSSDYTFFDPRISYKCELRSDSYSVIIKGVLKLDAINKSIDSDGEGNFIEYEVELHDSRAELFSKISDKYLTDINLYNKFNHLYTRDNIVDGWGHTYKDAYTYPKYYKTSTTNISDWHPAFYVRYLIDRIIGDQGFTYEIKGVDDDVFNKLIIPWTGGKQNIFSGDLATNKCTVGLYNSNQLGYANAGTNSYNYMSNGIHWGCLAFGFYDDDGTYLPYSSLQVGCIQQSAMNLPLSKEAPAPFEDNNNLWNNSPSLIPGTDVNTYLLSGSFFAPEVAGKYQFDFSGRTVVNINSDQLLVGALREARVTIGIARTRNGVYEYITGVDKIITEQDVHDCIRRESPYYSGYANKITFYDTEGTNYVDTSFDAPIVLKKEIDAWIGDEYHIYLRLENDLVYTISQAQFPAEAWIDEPTVKLEVSLMNGTIDENQTVVLSEYMPKNIKQSDFLNDLCKMFNFYIIEDKTRENHLIFKTAEEFYGEEYIDWTDKLDYNSNFRVEFLPDIIPGRMKFTYKEDDDLWNKNYTDETNEIFGEYTKDLWYSSTKTEEKVELTFSPTPQQDQYDIPDSTESYTTMAIDAVEPKANLRILSYSYPEDGIFTWNYNINGVRDTFTYTAYPFAGHNNHPVNPTHDLNFGEVDFDFFSDYEENSTDNNLFNKYYSSYFNMISEGKLITAYFYLTNEDIHNLDLSKKVFVKDNFYYINSIQDFNCAFPGITKVELIKINEGIKFSRKNIFRPVAAKLNKGDLVKMKAKIDAEIISRNNDFSSNSIAVVGQGNVTNRDTNNVTIEGNNNSIDINSSNVRMYGANNISVPYGAKDIVYINTSGHTTGVTNYTTYINDIKISGSSLTANTIYSGKIYSGGTDLYDIFQTSGSDVWIEGEYGSYSIKANNNSSIYSIGNYSVAEGYNTIAGDDYAHAEGDTTIASGRSSHAEGAGTLALGLQSHAEGNGTIASGSPSHAEGQSTTSNGDYSHSEGYGTVANGESSHAEGASNVANGINSHAEGKDNITNADYSHIGGSGNTLTVEAEGSAIIASQNMTGTAPYTLYSDNIDVKINLSAATFYSGSTDLYDIFLTTADGNDITRVQPGLNTYTGGTENNPTVNISAATFNGLTVSGITSLNTLSSSTIQCGNLVSTGNTVVMANSGGVFYSADTQSIETIDITGLDLTFGNISASTISATTIISSGDLNVNISSGKTIVMSNVAWRDEYPGSPWVAAGAAAAPDQSNYTIAGVNVRKWSFDGGNTEERLSSNFEIPHDYKVGEPIEAHVHWMPSSNNSGITAWYFDYAYCPVYGNPVTATTLAVSATTSANTQYNHYITSIGFIDDTLNYSLGDLIIFNLRRTPTTDTYADDAILLQVSLHVPVDTMGSRLMYTK